MAAVGGAASGGAGSEKSSAPTGAAAVMTKAQKAEARERAEQLVLQLLSTDDKAKIDTYYLAADSSNSCSNKDLEAAVKSLELDGYVSQTASSVPEYFLTDAGQYIEAAGQSPEVELFNLVPLGEDGIPMKELKAAASPLAFKSLKDAYKKGLLKSRKGVVVRNVAEVDDPIVGQLRAVKADKSSEPDASIVKRKFVKVVKVRRYEVTRGASYQPVRVKPVADLTKEMMVSGDWEKATFKPYNFDAEGVEPRGGHLHTLLKVRAEFRRVLMGMGFSEMPTSRYVESSFWNFDALYQPQSHPARDAHDTFFVSEPAATRDVPKEYMEIVKKTHEKGGFGSVGYGCDWKEEEARKNILRTHTTAVSARMLYKLANQEGGFKPVKYFSIDRVFRNEALDATHLAEFHQVEGVVADYNLGLADLIGTIRSFFHQIGITKLRFKPAYNPYTEPSMEIFGYHPDLKSWTEIGNSGVFRPEMLRPMGLPKDVRVIAWGLSLERPTMIKYRVKNIRKLFGHKVRIGMVRKTPLVRF